MKELDLAIKMLNKIILEGVNFQDAIKVIFPPESKDKQLQGAVCAFVGCELRHHNLLKEVSKNIPNLTDEEKFALYLVIANVAFLKRYEHQDMITALKEKLGEKYVNEIDDVFNTSSDLISACKGLDPQSPEYASVRFNTPVWLVKMWEKHFSKTVTYKILHKNSRQALQTVRVNTNKIETAKFLEHNPDFKATSVPDIVCYTGKGQVRKTPFFRNFDVFNEKMTLKLILDKVVDIPAGEILTITGLNDSIVKELYLKANGHLGVNVAVPSIDERPELLRFQRLVKPLNISIFNAPSYLDMNAAVTKKQDLAIVYPASSSFDFIRQYPDYLLHFQHEEVDRCVAKQKEALEGADKFLLPNSKLVYIVNTINKKESRSIISDFLSRHHDYELVEDKQFLPFDEYDTAMYYAILFKKEPEIND